ncbi:hypothetical protein CFC21_073714 [Triticum aestivum]|uniref:Aminotransferase-like plant mobile domain-containing protein n=2 Tax=Triticum aestivum TaxID=4565 RepID=A0A9R1KVH2_WHEAT|nr:uncharacterized protein LOC123113457 [Triticum aestivum]KAF7067886.1 hypothetical protein CFC21_073714 [Triticum aestivum]
MSTDDELRGLLVQESTAAIVSGADPSSPTARSAHFLLPRAGAAPVPALPPPPRNADPVPPADELTVEWTDWPGCSKLWRRWVAKLRPRHERMWRKLGILDGLLATTGWVRWDEDLLLQLAGFWSGETNTFLFPWGEATVTLEDMAVLGGLPLLGGPVWSRLPDELRGDVDALEAVRIALNWSKSKKVNYTLWIKHFIEENGAGAGAGAAGDGRGEAEVATLLEHGAFLAMWLTRYVLPVESFDVVRADVLPLAAGLARGRCSALAPAVLANIYNDLSALSHHLSLGASHQPFVASAPLHILQLWVWERFPELCPAINSHDGDPGMPRAAKWYNIRRMLDPGHIHAVFMSPEAFQWRPYGGSSIALPPGKGGCWVHCHEVATSKELQSFAQCLRPCELVGMQCIEQYCPHRVARQLGFDQDVPGTVARANSSRKTAWATYKMQPENVSLFVPQRDPGVTVEYAQWWQQYSSACAAAIANAARMKQLHVTVVGCGKKRHLEAGMSLQDDTEQDEILLEETHILEDDTAKQNSETVKDFVPRWAGKGRRRAISRKVAEKAISDAEAILVSEFDKPLCGPVTKNEHFQKQASGSVVTYDEKNLSSEHGEVKGAASARSNKGIGAAIGADMYSNLPDILAISGNELDEIFRKDSEASAIYMELSKLTMATSNSDRPNEEFERHLVTIRRDEQDCSESKDIMVPKNCDYELPAAQSDSTLRQGPVNKVTHAINVQTNVDVLEGRIDEMQARNVMAEGDQRAKVDRQNSTVFKGNNDDASYNGLAHGNNELGKRVISTKTLYYLRPFERVKDAQVRDSRATNAGQVIFQPGREVGTTEMIREASQAREAEKVELETIIDHLKKQVVALEVQLRDRRT